MGKHLDIVKTSVLGLVDIYNLLPQFVIDGATVSSFQHRLQVLLKTQACDGDDNWGKLFSPRMQLWDNRLRSMSAYKAECAYKLEVGSQQTNDTSNCIDAWLNFAF